MMFDEAWKLRRELYAEKDRANRAERHVTEALSALDKERQMNAALRTLYNGVAIELKEARKSQEGVDE